MSKLKDVYYNLKNFLINLIWMLPAAWKFRCWDSAYNIELFCKSLEVTANTIKIYGNSVNKKQQYRRCLIAAASLRQAYNFKRHEDLSLQQLNKNNPRYFERHEGYSIMKHKFKISEEHYVKQFELVSKRLDKQEKELKTSAWNYINKYIEQWWD